MGRKKVFRDAGMRTTPENRRCTPFMTMDGVEGGEGGATDPSNAGTVDVAVGDVEILGPEGRVEKVEVDAEGEESSESGDDVGGRRGRFEEMLDEDGETEGSDATVEGFIEFVDPKKYL